MDMCDEVVRHQNLFDKNLINVAGLSLQLKT